MKYARIIVLSIIFLLYFASCASTAVTDADIVAGNSRAVGQLEATVASLDRTIADSRERIAAVIDTSRSIADGISRLEYLFGCYEREVIELQREIDSIRNEAQGAMEGNSNTVLSGTISCSFYICPFLPGA